MHSTNYFNTLNEIADDSPTREDTIPAERAGAPTQAGLQYAMPEAQPYRRPFDEVLFKEYARRNNFAEAVREVALMDYFSEGQACFQASPLIWGYGWGVHFDALRKMGETEEYVRFLAEPAIKTVKSMPTAGNGFERIYRANTDS